MGGAKLRTEPLQNSRARENYDWTDSLASCLNLPCRDLKSSQPLSSEIQRSLKFQHKEHGNQRKYKHPADGLLSPYYEAAFKCGWKCQDYKNDLTENNNCKI